jgi:polysaccharide export outer membrane protein
MRRLTLAMSVASVLLASCSSGPATQAPVVSATPPAYRLAPDDKVRVNVYNEEGLTGTYVVGSDGAVSYPLLGSVQAAGLTLPQLQELLTNRLRSGYVKDPKVSVDITEYRPFYILGEVNKAGQYPYRVGLTVDAAVATAGGFTYRANHRVVAIQHRNQPQEVRYKLEPGVQVLPGDTVRILERFF